MNSALSRPATMPRFSRGPMSVQALFKKSGSTTAVKEPPAKEKNKQSSFLSQTLNALDFTETRSKKDAELLYEAKYGKRGADGKMTAEQYGALRRKVIGTAKDYWKEWVEEEQVKTVKTYYKPNDKVAQVPYLPFLVGVLVAMLATTVFVVQQTS